MLQIRIISKYADLTINRLDLLLSLPRAQLLGDPALEASTTKHAIGTLTVERSFQGALETGADAAQRAEVLTTFRPLCLSHWVLRYFQDLAGLHLI